MKNTELHTIHECKHTPFQQVWFIRFWIFFALGERGCNRSEFVICKKCGKKIAFPYEWYCKGLQTVYVLLSTLLSLFFFHLAQNRSWHPLLMLLYWGGIYLLLIRAIQAVMLSFCKWKEVSNDAEDEELLAAKQKSLRRAESINSGLSLFFGLIAAVFIGKGFFLTKCMLVYSVAVCISSILKKEKRSLSHSCVLLLLMVLGIVFSVFPGGAGAKYVTHTLSILVYSNLIANHFCVEG